MNNGLVSVVIPAYNAAWCIGRALDSALAQTYSQREIIVVDDGSTDDTAAHLDRFGDRIRVICQKNGGLPSARNAGIAAAKGEFVAFLDADDWWLPTKLERQVTLLQAHPEVGFCSSAAQVVSAEGKPLNVWPCPANNSVMLEQIFENPSLIPGSGSGVMLRRALVDRVGDFDRDLRSLEDIDMWMRLASVSGYACIAEALTVILRSSQSMSRNLDAMRSSALQVLRKNRHLLPSAKRGGFWQTCYASTLTDYAKWEYRAGRRGAAIAHLLEAFTRAPVTRGRLALGLLAAVVLGRQV